MKQSRTNKFAWADEFKDTISKLLEPAVKFSKKKWLRQIFLYCFDTNKEGKKLYAYDYSAVVYAHSDGKLAFESLRAFKEPFDINLVPYIGKNPLPVVA